MMYIRLVWGLVVAALIGLTAPSPFYAQETCTPLVEQAIAAVGDACTGLGINQVCYGNPAVTAIFAESPDAPFQNPGSRASLLNLTTLQTAPLDLLTEIWGVALMRVQANLPGTLPGQGVAMVIFGDTQLANGVPAESVEDAPALPARTQVNLRLRTRPDLDADIVTVVPEGGAITVDGVSADGEWVRVVANGDLPGWAAGQFLAINGDLTTLPVVDGAAQTPMGAFYFSTGVGAAGCNTAPDAVMIQSPGGYAITLNVNEANIRIGSTVVLETVSDDEMAIYVLDGEAYVNNLVVPAGFKAFAPIGQPDDDTTPPPVSRPANIPIVTGEWRSCTELEAIDRERFSVLENIDPALLNYPVRLPGDTDAICASPEELLALSVGSCRNFRGISPRQTMPAGPTTFYWEPLRGAASYSVLFYREGAPTTALARFDTSGAQTNLLIDTASVQLQNFFFFEWEVQAVGAGGEILCTTPRVAVVRGATNRPNPQSPPDDSNLTYPNGDDDEED